MSDSRNAAEAISRNYATPSGAAPQAIPAIQFLNTFLSPVSCPSSFHYLVSRFPACPASLFFLRFIQPGGSRAGLLPSTLTHTRAVTDSADILVPSIPGYQPPLERPSEPSGAVPARFNG